MSSKKHTRYRLLLDEGLPKKEKFPNLNNLHTIKHIVHELRKGGAKDSEVYSIANKERNMVVIFNTKDFKGMMNKSTISVISLSSSLTTNQIDTKVCKALKELKPSEIFGRLISITNTAVTKKIKD